MNVRSPQPHEFQAMAEKGRDFWLSSPYKSIPYDIHSMVQSFEEMTAQGLMIIAEEDGAIFGGIGSVTVPAYFNRNYLIGVERFWWLDPNKRSSLTGLLLIRSMEDAVRKSGCHYFSMMALEESDPDRAEFIYRRMGFEPTERMYLKQVSPWAS